MVDKKIQLIIELDQKGLFVHGPIRDKILCLGMIELAKDIIKAGKPEKENIVIPSMVPPFMKQ